MLQASNSGSSDEVVFTMKVSVDPNAKNQLDAFNRYVDGVRANVERPIRVSTIGGPIGGGMSGAGVGSTPYSAVGSSLADMRNIPRVNSNSWQQGLDAANQQSMSVRDRVLGNVLNSANARADAVDARAEGWRRRQDASNNFWRNDPAMSGMGSYTGGNWHGGGGGDDKLSAVNAKGRQAVEAVTSLARSFAYLGAASEASLEKAVRGIAKLEAGAAGVRGVMGLAQLAGVGAMAGGVVGVGVVAGLAGFSYLNGSQDRRRAQQDAEQDAIDQAAKRQAQDDYNAFLRQDETLAGYGRTDDRRSERTTYGITSAGRRGDRAALVEARDRASFWAESYSSGPVGADGFDTDGTNAAAEALRYRKEELAATQELARLDEARARDNVESARYVVDQLEHQLRLEETRVRQAENKQESGAAAYGSMNGRQRSQFNAAYEAHQRGEVLTDSQLAALSRGDPEAAQEARVRRGEAADYGNTSAGQANAANVAATRGDREDVQGMLGQPGGSTGAYADAQTAASDLEAIRGKAQERVDGIVSLIFDAMDRLEERIEARQRTRDGMAVSARP
jgi:hypothetical protein|tara:strand:+ start:81 stop:1772 length:1692 start_codon:yes stop_codon:yes gene_type:complete